MSDSAAPLVLPGTAAELAPPPARSPGQLFWRQLRNSPLAIAGGVLLALFYLGALLAPFLAPYPPDAMDRERFFHPPQPLHWIDASGRFHPVPFVHPTALVDPRDFSYREESRVLPLRWFIRGSRYRLLGVIPAARHLYGVDAGEHVFLLGTDGFGRDVLSRLLYGGQISLTVGIVGIAISFTLGMLLGGISGYFGGWVDTLIMRSTELLLSIPGLYLIVALRSLFPVDLPSQQTYLGIVGILALIGWAVLARVIRGM